MPLATQSEPLQQLPAPMHELAAQQAAPSLPQAEAVPPRHTMPLVPGMFWPDATQALLTQQPPPAQLSPGQQGWPGPPQTVHMPALHEPPVEQVEASATH